MTKTAQLEFAEWARKDLLKVARYIARDNPQRARSFVNKLRQQCTLLVEQPGWESPSQTWPKNCASSREDEKQREAQLRHSLHFFYTLRSAINIGSENMASNLMRATIKLVRYLLDYFFQWHRRAAHPVIKIGSITVLPLLLLMACDACVAAAPNFIVAPMAKLLFKSNFGPGVSLSNPYGLYATAKGGGGGWQNLTGTDRETGYTWPVAALSSDFSGVQLITTDPVDLSTIGNHITAEIRQVPGPQGTPVYELFQNVKIKLVGLVPDGKGRAQAPLMIKRPWTIPDVTDLYVTYWFKHQANLAEKLDSGVSSGNWRMQFEFKTGGYQNKFPGDYRIATGIKKDSDGSLYWYTKGSNAANGPWPKVEYWGEDSHTVLVPVDTWFKFEVYWHRSAGGDGRYWSAVNGQVIVDHHGSNMGKENLPITRIMIDNTYSGGHPEVQSQITGLEIWDGFPCGVGVTCF